MSEDSRTEWSRVLIVGGLAFITVLGIDRLLNVLLHFNPPLMELMDVVAEYEVSDPQVLVLGSSHARSFETVGKVLAQKTDNKVQMLAVPLEWGKLSSYLWVLRHRLAPFIEEKDKDGHLVRRSLQHLSLRPSGGIPAQ